jgi:hypothetical protein
MIVSNECGGRGKWCSCQRALVNTQRSASAKLSATKQSVSRCEGIDRCLETPRKTTKTVTTVLRRPLGFSWWSCVN